MITCASGIPRDIVGISFQLVLGGVVRFGSSLILLSSLHYLALHLTSSPGNGLEDCSVLSNRGDLTLYLGN